MLGAHQPSPPLVTCRLQLFLQAGRPSVCWRTMHVSKTRPFPPPFSTACLEIFRQHAWVRPILLVLCHVLMPRCCFCSCSTGTNGEQIVDQIGTADNPGPCFGTTNECLGSQVSCGHPPSCLPPQNKLRVASRSLWMPLHHCLPSCCPPTDLLPNRPLCHLPGRRRLLPHLHHRPARLFAAVSQRCTTCNAGHNTLCRWSWHAAGRHATLHPAAAPLG